MQKKNGDTLDTKVAMTFNARILENKRFQWTGDALGELVERHGIQQGILAEAIGTYLANLGLYGREGDRFLVIREDVQRVIDLITQDLTESKKQKK